MKQMRSQIACLLILYYASIAASMFDGIIDGKVYEDWTKFLNDNVLDMTEGDGASWESWPNDKWNIWLKKTLGEQYSKKPTHNVIVETPAYILAAFNKEEEEHPTETATRTVGGQPEEMVWGAHRFDLIHMVLSEGIYIAYRVTHPMYVLAALAKDGPIRPVHFQTQKSDEIPQNGPLPEHLNTVNCLSVNFDLELKEWLMRAASEELK